MLGCIDFVISQDFIHPFLPIPVPPLHFSFSVRLYPEQVQPLCIKPELVRLESQLVNIIIDGTFS